MSEFLLKKNVFALVTIIIFCIVKLCIDFFGKPHSRAFSNSLFASDKSANSTSYNINFYIKILNNFLTITVLAAVIVYLFAFDVSEKDPKAGTEIFITLDSAEHKPVEQKTAELADVQFINTKPLEKIEPIERTLIITKSVRKKTTQVYKRLSIAPVEIKKPVAPAVEVKKEEPLKVEEKDLGTEEMDSILTIVNATRKELGISSKCVQVIKTRGSNVANAFDLAKFFKKNGYVIAGRELKSDNVDGFKILVSGIIIKVTVGTFPVELRKTE